MNKILFSFVVFSLLLSSCAADNKERAQTAQDSVQVVQATSDSLQLSFSSMDSLAFYPDAMVELYTPLGNQIFKPGKVPFEFNVKNFPLRAASTSSPRLRMILNGSDPEGYSSPIFQKELTRGTYRVVAYLVDEKGFALKNFGNYVDRDFMVGDSRAFPYSAEPYIAVNLPKNGQILAFGEPLLLDFLILGGDLALDNLKVKVLIGGDSTEVTSPNSIRITNLPKGDHQLKIQLLRKDNKELDGPFSSSTKTVFVR
ncbi:MAG: hypothetical protein ACK5BR_04725 [Bacteroidota bacterium]|nr:hypothetical protein [Algoriphagus sp.]